MFFKKNKIDKAIKKASLLEENNDFDYLSSQKKDSIAKKMFIQPFVDFNSECKNKKMLLNMYTKNNKMKIFWVYNILFYFVILAYGLYNIFSPISFVYDGLNAPISNIFNSLGNSINLSINGIVFIIFIILFLISYITFMLFSKKNNIPIISNLNKTSKTISIINYVFCILGLLLIILINLVPPSFPTMVWNEIDSLKQMIIDKINVGENVTADIKNYFNYFPDIKLIATAEEQMINEFNKFIKTPEASLPTFSYDSLIYKINFNSIGSEFAISGYILTVILIVTSSSVFTLGAWIYFSNKRIDLYSDNNEKINTESLYNVVLGWKNKYKLSNKKEKSSSRETFKQYKDSLKEKGMNTDVSKFTTDVDHLPIFEQTNLEENIEPKQEEVFQQTHFVEKDIEAKNITDTRRMFKRNKTEIALPEDDLDDILKDLDL